MFLYLTLNTHKIDKIDVLRGCFERVYVSVCYLTLNTHKIDYIVVDISQSTHKELIEEEGWRHGLGDG